MKNFWAAGSKGWAAYENERLFSLDFSQLQNNYVDFFLPEAKSNHKLLDSTDYSCRFLHKYECQAIAHQKSNQKNVRKFSSGSPHHRSIVISMDKKNNSGN